MLRLSSKLLGGCGLTRAAFYQISADGMLVRFLSGSSTSCLACLWPFIEILRSLVLCESPQQTFSGKLLAIGFAATMQLL